MSGNAKIISAVYQPDKQRLLLTEKEHFLYMILQYRQKLQSNLKSYNLNQPLLHAAPRRQHQ